MHEFNDNNQNLSSDSGQYCNSDPGYYNQPCHYGNDQPAGGYPQYYNPYDCPNGQMPYGQAQSVNPPVSNAFCYILMALTAVSAILTIAATITMIRSSVDGSLFSSLPPGQEYASLYALLLRAFANSPALSFYPTLNQLLRTAILVVSILDIVQVRRRGYPILGMVIFTIFFKPGYFIWRAYAAKQKKLIPVLFTVFYILLHAGYFVWCFLYVMSLS